MYLGGEAKGTCPKKRKKKRERICREPESLIAGNNYAHHQLKRYIFSFTTHNSQLTYHICHRLIVTNL